MRRLLLPVLLLTAFTAHAASEYPPSFAWRTVTTDHFLVHFHQGEDDLARRAATIAEHAHERLVPMLGWEPQDRTHLILTDHVDVSNGSATPFPSNRIEIYVSAPGADPSSPLEYYDNWLNLVITHEYAHILHLDQARGFAGVMRKVFGRHLFFGFPNLWSPPWLTEGLATLVESEATDAGRLKGTYVDMILRTAAVENRFATEGQAAGFSPQWPGGGARYFYGSKFLEWLGQKHGPDKVREYINEYSSNVIPFRLNATATDVYGTGMKQLWNEWSEEQQRIYREQHAALGALTQRESITGLGYETKYPLLSPDGTRLAYTHEGPFERPTIRVRDLAQGRDVATHEVNTGSALSWSKDGRSIAYSQLEFAGSLSVLSDVYVWEVGGEARRITNGARVKDPSFTPDGRALVAVDNRAGRNRIVEIDVATGAVRPVVTPDGYEQFSEPAVSTDGQRIAVAKWDAGRVDIVIYDRKGLQLANLTGSMQRATNASPRFSPDDSTIYFTSDVTGIPNVFSVASKGGEPRRVTNVYGGAFFPTSGDGRRFYYSDYSSRGFDVAMFDAGPDYPVTQRVLRATVDGAPEPSITGQSAPYSPWSSLRPRWWFPIFLSELGENDETEVTIGATTSGADVLGFHSYTATATVTSGGAESDSHYSLLYAYDRLYPTISLGALRFEDNTETTQRFIGQVLVPFRRVRWQTAAWAGFVRDDISDTSTASGTFRGTLQGIRAGALFSNAREYAYSVSPENGFSARADYENLSGALGSDASLQQWRGDLRGYLTIPWSRAPLGRHVLAARVAGAENRGDFVRQRELRVGGNEDFGFPDLDIRRLPVRGYASGTLRGQRAAIASLEYRFPIWEIERGPATLPVFFNRIIGDVFADAGRAADRTIASAGAEVGVDLYLGHILPIRYRVGVAWPLREPGKGDVSGYAAFSTSF